MQLHCGDPVSHRNVVCGVLLHLWRSFGRSRRYFCRLLRNMAFKSEVLVIKDIKYWALFRIFGYKNEDNNEYNICCASAVYGAIVHASAKFGVTSVSCGVIGWK